MATDKCKRFLALTLAAALLLLALPAFALAAGASSVEIDGNIYAADASGEGWALSGLGGDAPTLTLSGYNGGAIIADGDLAVALEGTNAIDVSAPHTPADGEAPPYYYGIKTGGSLEITGAGSLEITLEGAADNGWLAGINAVDDFILDSAVSVNVRGGATATGVELDIDEAAALPADMLLKDGAKLEITLETLGECSQGTATADGIYVSWGDLQGSVTAEKGSSLNIKATCATGSYISSAAGLYAVEANAILAGETAIDVNANDEAFGACIVMGDLSFPSGSNVNITAEAANGYGIDCADSVSLLGECSVLGSSAAFDMNSGIQYGAGCLVMPEGGEILADTAWVAVVDSAGAGATVTDTTVSEAEAYASASAAASASKGALESSSDPLAALIIIAAIIGLSLWLVADFDAKKAAQKTIALLLVFSFVTTSFLIAPFSVSATADDEEPYTDDYSYEAPALESYCDLSLENVDFSLGYEGEFDYMQAMAAASGGDGDYTGKEPFELGPFILQGLASGVLGAIAGYGVDKILTSIFGDATAEALAEINKKLDQILKELQEIKTEWKSEKYRETFKQHWVDTNKFASRVTTVIDALTTKGTKPATRKQQVDEFIGKMSDKESGFQKALTFADELMFKVPGDKGSLNMFQIYDAYATVMYAWEHRSYDFRQSARDTDITVFGSAAAIAMLYCKDHLKQDSAFYQKQFDKLTAKAKILQRFYVVNKVVYHGFDLRHFNLINYDVYVKAMPEIKSVKGSIQFYFTSGRNYFKSLDMITEGQKLDSKFFEAVVEYYKKAHPDWNMAAMFVSGAEFIIPANNNEKMLAVYRGSYADYCEWDISYADVRCTGFWLTDKKPSRPRVAEIFYRSTPSKGGIYRKWWKGRPPVGDAWVLFYRADGYPAGDTNGGEYVEATLTGEVVTANEKTFLLRADDGKNYFIYEDMDEDVVITGSPTEGGYAQVTYMKPPEDGSEELAGESAVETLGEFDPDLSFGEPIYATEVSFTDHDDDDEASGVITDFNAASLTLQEADGNEITFDITKAEISGEIAIGAAATVYYHVDARFDGGEPMADEVVCSAIPSPEPEPDPIVDPVDDDILAA